MIRLVVLILLILMPTEAQALTCAEVRAVVATYGRAQALILARLKGLTEAQIRQARACLK